MKIAAQIAQHLRDIHFGGNWTWSSMKEHLSDVTYSEATRSVDGMNSIAALVFHMNFYLNVVQQRLKGEKSAFKHEDSFAVPSINSQEEWQNLLNKTWADAEAFASLIEVADDDKLWQNISEQYGSYYKNLHGVVEHNHYHLGQIVMLKKLIRR